MVQSRLNGRQLRLNGSMMDLTHTIQCQMYNNPLHECNHYLLQAPETPLTLQHMEHDTGDALELQYARNRPKMHDSRLDQAGDTYGYSGRSRARCEPRCNHSSHGAAGTKSLFRRIVLAGLSWINIRAASYDYLFPSSCHGAPGRCYGSPTNAPAPPPIPRVQRHTARKRTRGGIVGANDGMAAQPCYNRTYGCQ